MNPKKIVIIGGGAAGFFLASQLEHNEKYEVLLLEKTAKVLQKVKVSGGGRCNVTHAEFSPSELVKNYPRGHKELRSVFARFQPADTFSWFEEKGLELKVEADNRVFPITNSSQSIIDIFEKCAAENKVDIRLQKTVQSLTKSNENFIIHTSDESFEADFVVICPGASNACWQWIETDLGHSIISPVPSLFTFNSKDEILQDLQGTSFENATVSIPELKQEESGAMLITHWGISGPAVLKLSAFAARELADLNYEFNGSINFISDTLPNTFEALKDFANENPNSKMEIQIIYPTLSKRFWHRVLFINRINLKTYWAEISHKELQKIAETLCSYTFTIKGKSTFKEEFVTAGGVDLKEIDMRRMESKLHPNLYFAGEILNIDAVTGGFNFQACWSEAFLIAEDLKLKIGN